MAAKAATMELKLHAVKLLSHHLLEIPEKPNTEIAVRD